MGIEVLDPTHEAVSGEFVLANRLATLEGATVGLVSNGKEGTKRFFDAFERALVENHGAAKVVLLTKKNYSAPAEPEILEQSTGWDALIAGVGD
jgi:hypothetical protein